MAPPSSAVGFTKRRMVSAVYQSKPTADDIGGFTECRRVPLAACLPVQMKGDKSRR